MTEPPSESPFWTYEDLLLFLGAILPCWVLGLVIVRIAGVRGTPAQTLTFQSVFFALLLLVLYVLISVRYGRPFWRSLGWTAQTRGLWWCIAAAPALAIGTAALGAVMRAPDVPNIIEGLITGRASLIIVMVFVVAIGPVYEELLFRGFLYPLVARSFGPALGIVLSAIPFAVLHGPQNQWSWQHMTLVGMAGAVFGYARYKTGSTAAATVLHCGYNLTQFAGYLAQRAV